MSSGFNSNREIRSSLNRINKASRQRLARGAALAAASLLLAQSAKAGNGTWTNPSGGNWSTTANWLSGSVASGNGAIADFSTLSLSSSPTVHLNNPYTVGQLNFGDQNNSNSWLLDNNGNFSNTLTLSGSSIPAINVVNQQATISAALAGTQGFTKTGSGILELTGVSTYTGMTNVSNGTLVLGSAASSSSAPAPGAVVDLDPNLSTVTTSGGAVTGVSDLSGNNNNASNSNAPGSVTLSTINGHKAFYFNGSSGLTDSTFAATGNPETVFAVINPATVTGPSAIVAANASGGLELRLYQGNLQMLREAQAGFSSSTSSVPTNTLSIVALAYNTSNGTYYLNGTAIGNTNSGNPALSGSGTLTIGNKVSSGGVNEFFNGSMGTILIYNSVLSAQDMATTEAFLTQEYAATSSTLGNTLVNLTSASSALSIASSSQSIASLAGVANSNVYLGGGLLTVGTDGTNTTFAGNISDTGTGAVGTGGVLVKAGAGSLTLSGTVSNTGGAQVTAGSLIISGSNTTSGPTSVTAGSLVVSGVNATSGPNSVSGGLLSVSGVNSATGPFTIGSTGTLSFSGPSTASGAISIASGGTLLLQATTSNITGTGASATSSAIGSPSSLTYADAAITNIKLRGDTSVTFANASPTGGTGSGAIMNFDVNNLGGTSTATNQTLTLGSTTAGTAGFATYQTTINVTGGNGFTLGLPSITNANNSYLNLNASTGNLSVGSVNNIGTLTVTGASNTSIGSITGPSAGGGVLVKSGTGVLTLTGSNTYTGNTNISGGTLALASGATLTSTPAISIAHGSIFDISANPTFALASSTAILGGSGTINGSYNHSIGILAPGGLGTVGTLAITGGLTLSGGTVNLDISGSDNTTGGTANDLITLGGPLTLVGNNTLTLGPVNPTLPSGTTWTVITYSGSAPAGTGTLNVSTGAFSIISVPGAIELKYNSGSVGVDVWTGSVNNNWDTSTTNFVPTGSTSPISFTNGDAVLFNDTSTVTGVNLAQTLSPSTITVNSNTSNYNFSGSGSISGTAFLTKTGSSILTIGTSNTYTGTNNVSGGTVVVNNTSGYGLGTGPLIIGTGATVQVGDGGTDGAINNASILDNGTLAYNSPSSNFAPPTTLTGTGSLYINVGSIGIGNQNTYSGGTNIVGGVVYAYEAATFGTGPVVVNGGTVITDYGKDFPNNFTLSGQAITAGGNSISEIGGTTILTGDTTITIDGGSGFVFGSTVTSAGFNLILNGGGNSATLTGNVSLGAGQVQASVPVVLSPAATTTLTVSSGITGSASVTHNTTGTSILSGSNSYTGGSFVQAGTLSFNGPSAFPLFSSLNVSAGAVAAAGIHGVHNAAPKNDIFASSLTIAGTTNAWTGKLDLGDNDLLVQNGDINQITNMIKSGYAGSTWTGQGITSSAAKNDTTGLTTLGVLLNNDGSGSTLYGTFDGQSAQATDVLVKYTYVGDANLDGHVDGSDYTRIDNGFNNGLTGWGNGDFNYDGVVNGSDYTLIDNAFNTQGASLQADATDLVASSASQVWGSSSVPEPTSLGLLLAGTAGLLARRRRQV